MRRAAPTRSVPRLGWARFGAAISIIAASASAADAKLQHDVLPTEDSAKTVAWSALKGFVGPQSFEDKWKEYFPSVEVEGKYWVVVFRPIDWEKRDRRLDNNNMIRTTHPDGSEEILFRDPHCGFCAEVKIRRNDAKVRSITFIR